MSDLVKSEKDAGTQKDNETKNKKADTGESNKVSSILTDQSLNFDDILKCDTIPGLLSVNAKLIWILLWAF